MEFIKTKDFIFKQCAERVKNRISERNLTLEEIYPPNSKMISRIQNNKRYDSNPYLLTDTIIEPIPSNVSSVRNIGLVPLLFRTKRELLWGTDEEIKNNLYQLFKYIVMDLLEEPSKIEIDINYILCDYVPYAENYANWYLLYESDIKHSPILNTIDSTYIADNRERLLLEAISFLYLKCDLDFYYIFMDFTETVSSYKKINHVLYKQFIIPHFIPMIRKYLPNTSSLGIRVRDIIISDYSSLSELIIKGNGLSNLYKKYYNKLLDASFAYVSELADIQKIYTNPLKQ